MPRRRVVYLFLISIVMHATKSLAADSLLESGSKPVLLAESGAGESLLPVLASRDDAVQDTVAELFGDLASLAVRGGSDAAGWARGELAADLAKLNAADLTAAPEPAP